jgi:hypothetical protein
MIASCHEPLKKARSARRLTGGRICVRRDNVQHKKGRQFQTDQTMAVRGG